MRGSPQRFDDMSGGVDLKNSAYLVDATRARDLLDVVSTQRGSIRTRDGSTSFHHWSVAPRSLFALEETTVPYLITSYAGRLVAVGVDGALGPVASVSGSDGYWEWVSAPANGGQGPAYGMNGTVARYFNGTTFSSWTSSAGTLPIGKIVVAWDNRVVVLGQPSAKSTVTASAIGNPRDFDVTSDAWANEMDPSDGQETTGAGVVGSYLIVFKPNKVFTLYDSNTGASRRLAENVGCRAHRSIVESPYGLFFLSEDGVYLTDGDKLERISDLVDPLLNEIPAPQRGYAAGAFYNDRYYLSIPTGVGDNDRTLEYDPRKKSWWIHTVAAQQWAPWRRVNDQLELYGTKGLDTFRALVPGAIDDIGVAYIAFWKSGWHAFGKPYLRKRCRSAHFDGTGEFSFYVAKDFVTSDTLLGVVDFAAVDGVFGGSGLFGGGGVFGGGRAAYEKKLYTLGLARAWSVVFSGSDPFEIDSYTLAMTERRN